MILVHVLRLRGSSVAPQLAPLSLCSFGQEPAGLPSPRIGGTTVIAIEQYNDHVYVQLNALYMQAW
jgi:hypothetical protein